MTEATQFIRRRVVTKWSEVRMSAAAFVELAPEPAMALAPAADEDIPRVQDVIEYPTLVFEKGQISVDELWWLLPDGNVKTSSWERGVSSPDGFGNQIRSYHGRDTDLGKWTEIRFTVRPKTPLHKFITARFGRPKTQGTKTDG